MKLFVKKILQKILKQLARFTIWRFNPHIITITGSVGKTSTREAIYTVLKKIRRVRRSHKSFNNELGVPLTILGDYELTEGLFFWPKVIIVALWNLLFKCNYPDTLILEYGVDRPGDMKYLLEIAKPSVGIFTAMGKVPVHIEYFADAKDVLMEKAKMIIHLPAAGFAVLNADEKEIYNLKNDSRAQTISFGFSSSANVQISNYSSFCDGETAGVTFKLSYGGSFVPIRLERVLGKSQAYSTAAAAAVGLIFGMHLIDIAEALCHYKSPAGRKRIIAGIKKSLIIDDTYNASPLAMQESIEALKELEVRAENKKQDTNGYRKIAILGDMLEIGKYTLEEHEIIGKLVAHTADLLITLGIRGKFIAEAAEKAGMDKKSIHTFSHIKTVIKFIREKIREGDFILVKGSQGARLEKVVKEIMADPMQASKLLVRQERSWLEKIGMYD